MTLTRRTLLTGALAAGAGLALGQWPQAAEASSPQPDQVGEAEHPSILYDLTKCAGCHLCEIGCQLNKGLPAEISLISFRSADPTKEPKGPWAVRRHQCMHCLDPACVAACPVAAMQKTPAGPVIYEDGRCLGCRYCMSACPFGVPTFDWNRGLLDAALIRKCDFCADRQARGLRPACIEACPTGAVIFGKRSEMLAEARRRIAANPDRYVNEIYGEHQAGGTSFLMIAGVASEDLGLPDPGTAALPPLPNKIMSGVIPFALAWTTVLGGVTAATHWKAGGKKEGAK